MPLSLRCSLLVSAGILTCAAPAAADSLAPAHFSGKTELFSLIGATVLASDDQEIGVVDDMLCAPDGSMDAVVIGLDGDLGLGEKDVALPFKSAKLVRSIGPAPVASQVFYDGRFEGSSPQRVKLDVSVAELRAAPAFKAGATGAPAPSSGQPESTTKEPKSSTQSGGPG